MKKDKDFRRGVNVCPFDVLNSMQHYCYDNLKEPGRSEGREDGVEKYIIMEYRVYGARGKASGVLWINEKDRAKPCGMVNSSCIKAFRLYKAGRMR